MNPSQFFNWTPMIFGVFCHFSSGFFHHLKKQPPSFTENLLVMCNFMAENEHGC